MEFHTIPPMDYGYHSSRCGSGGGDNMTTCLILGGVAIVVYTMMQQQNQTQMMRSPRFFYEQALQAPGAIASGISSMIATTKANELPDADTSLKIKKGVAKIIDNTSDSKVASDDEKKANEAKLRKWMKYHEDAIIILFAHWCPHCKDMIAKLETTVVEKKPSGIHFLLVNCESVASSAFTGDDKIYQLQYYPTVLCKKGSDVKQVTDPAEAIQLINTKKSEESKEQPKEEEPKKEKPKEEEEENESKGEQSEETETESQMLNKFF